MISFLWTFLSLVAVTAAMPTMYTQTTTLRIQIIEFANHTRLIIKTLTISIIAHCGSGKPYSPLPSSSPPATYAAKANAGALTAGAPVHTPTHPHTSPLTAFSKTETVVGVFLLTSFCLLVLSMVTYLGMIIYHSIGETIAYTSIKQQEADEEVKGEGMEGSEAAPEYTEA